VPKREDADHDDASRQVGAVVMMSELRRLARAIVEAARTEVGLGAGELVAACARSASAAGFAVHGVAGHERGSPVEAVAARLAASAVALAWRARPGERLAMILGGEPTIVRPAQAGAGGRAQHVAALVAEELATMPWPEHAGACVLAVADEGTAGPGTDTGGLVDAGTWARAGRAAPGWLASFDARALLAAAGDLVTSPSGGQNRGDIYLVLAVGSSP
jgi:glycerate-2-kinase